MEPDLIVVGWKFYLGMTACVFRQRASSFWGEKELIKGLYLQIKLFGKNQRSNEAIERWEWDPKHLAANRTVYRIIWSHQLKIMEIKNTFIWCKASTNTILWYFASMVIQRCTKSACSFMYLLTYRNHDEVETTNKHDGDGDGGGGSGGGDDWDGDDAGKRKQINENAFYFTDVFVSVWFWICQIPLLSHLKYYYIFNLRLCGWYY